MPGTKKNKPASRFVYCQAVAGLDTMGTVNLRDKILSREQLVTWREQLHRAGKKLVATNGCFDLLHLGHVTYLEAARQFGDALLVGVNCDATVRQLKGLSRPLNPELDRALVVAALQSVDAVYIFPELDVRPFLQLVRPDVYAKGGDYTLDTINQDERRLLEQMGCRVVLLAGRPGKSTTGLIEKMRQC